MRVEITRTKALEDTDQHRGRDRAGQAVEPADDDDGEDLEPDQGDAEPASINECPEDARDRGSDTGDRPYEREQPMHINPRRGRRIRVVGDRAQRDAGAAALIKPG